MSNWEIAAISSVLETRYRSMSLSQFGAGNRERCFLSLGLVITSFAKIKIVCISGGHKRRAITIPNNYEGTEFEKQPRSLEVALYIPSIFMPLVIFYLNINSSCSAADFSLLSAVHSGTPVNCADAKRWISTKPTPFPIS